MATAAEVKTETLDYLDRAIEGFDRDPPDTDFQRGYLEAVASPMRS